MDKCEIDREKISEEEIRKDLEQIISWSKDLKNLPFGKIPGSQPNKLDYIRDLQKEKDRGFDYIDRVILSYEILIDEKRSEKLEKDYPRLRVYEAGVACFNELNGRASKLSRIRRWYKKNQVLKE